MAEHDLVVVINRPRLLEHHNECAVARLASADGEGSLLERLRGVTGGDVFGHLLPRHQLVLQPRSRRSVAAEVDGQAASMPGTDL
jgi:hypothetical protein